MKSFALSIACLMLALQFARASVAEGEFTDTPVPPAGKGDVYLYRTTSTDDAMRSYTLSVDGQAVGKLPNASYLVLRLLPGAHTLSVHPGGPLLTSSLAIDVKSAHAAFYEFNVPTDKWGNSRFNDAAIEPRPRSAAVAQLKALRSAADGPMDLNSPSQFARVDDVAAVPVASEAGKAMYRRWLKAPTPRAFVVCANGEFEATWGRIILDPSEPADAAERALQRGLKSGKTDCRAYAIGDVVVWRPIK